MAIHKKTRKKWSFFDIAFTFLLAIFFLVSVFSCGSFQSTGNSTLIRSDENYLAVFEVKGSNRAVVKSVYLNIGHVSANEGDELAVKIKTSTSTSSAPSSSFGEDANQKTDGVKYIVGKDGRYTAYNWLELYSGYKEGKEFSVVSVTANYPFVLHEIVCVDENDKPVELQVNKNLSRLYVHPTETLAGAVDAPHSFSIQKTARYVYTAKESQMLSAIDNMRLGNKYEDGFIYHTTRGVNTLTTAIYLPSVAIFGHSVGALRLTSVLLTTVAIGFAYSFVKLLCKDDKSGFIASLLLVLSSLPFTAGRLGYGYALPFCLLVGGAYFILRFFAQGVKNERIKKSALPLLYSGLLSALAIATNWTAIVPVIGILVLFGFGLQRQKLAHEIALSELPEEDEEGQKTEKAVYTYKTKIVYGYTLLSFIVGTFVFVLLGGIIGYNTLVRAYDNPADPKLGFLALLQKNFTPIGLSNPFALLCPLSFTHILQSGSSYFTAFINPVVLIASLLSIVFTGALSIVSLVKKETGKGAKRLRRITVILLAFAVLSLIQAMLVESLTVLSALPLLVSLVAFIPFAYRTGCAFGKKGKRIADIALYAVVVLSAVFFLFSLSQIFGIGNSVFTLLQ